MPRLHERLNRRRRTPSTLRQLDRRDRPITSGERFQRLFLLRRTQLDVAQPSCNAVGQTQQLHLARAGQPSHGGGSHGFEHLAPRRQIVVRHPAREPQHGGREEAAGVDDSRHGFQTAFPCELRFRLDAVADHRAIAATKRNRTLASSTSRSARVGKPSGFIVRRPRGRSPGQPSPRAHPRRRVPTPRAHVE
jgi:hypothetical protein